MKNIPYIVSENSITCVIGGRPYTATSANANFSLIRERIANEDFDGIENLFNQAKAITSFTKGKVVVEDNSVTYNGKEVHNYVVDRILEFMRNGLPVKPLINFLEKLLQNPSFRAVNELYSFLEAAQCCICPDGDFLAYRKVTNDYKDFYTGKFDNSVGSTVEIPANEVDEDKNRTCSNGLHFCGQGYLNQYHGGNGRVVIVKISPANVQAIPADYNNLKGRCNKYTVIADCEGYENGEQFGALDTKYSPSEPDNEPSEAEIEEFIEDSYGQGYDCGEADSIAALSEDSDTAFEAYPDLDEEAFTDGYFDGFRSAPFVEEPKAKVKTISESTRRKLSKAARSQKRNGSGQFI